MRKIYLTFLLLFTLSQCAAGENEMLYVEVIVSEQIAKNGGVVFMIPHKLPFEEFNAKYSTEKADGIYDDGEKYQYKFDTIIKNTVSFLHFDAPQAEYRYRFLSVDGKYKIDEKQIGIAGAGNIYVDGDNNNPVFVDGGIDHAIIGKKFGESEARAVENSSLDFRISDSDCTASTGIFICSPSDDSVKNMLDSLAANDPK